MKVPSRPAWHHQAACRPQDGDVRRATTLMVEGVPSMAKRACQQCPVVVQCLEEALDDPGLRGVWGGMTDIERRRERQRRATR